MKLWAIPTCFVTGYQEEEIGTSPSVLPLLGRLQRAMKSPFNHFFSKIHKYTVLTGHHALQPFHQLWWPAQDTFKYLNNSFKLWGPELHTKSRWGQNNTKYSRNWIIGILVLVPRNELPFYYKSMRPAY